MQALRSKLHIALAICFFLVSVDAFAADRSMQLITSSTGWAIDGGRLFWTEDNGTSWRDISPPRFKSVTDVMFLDTSHGWVILANEDGDGKIAFSAASTNDAGLNWIVSHVNVPSQRRDELDGVGWLNFIDPLHGWAVLHARSSSAFSWALLLGTDDGGKSWNELPQAPIAGRPVFVTPQDGWISGGGGGGGVYRTRDGGRSWQSAGPSLEDLPAAMPTRAEFGNVKFTDSRHGFLPIRLVPSTDAENPRGTGLVLYATEDGGDSWKIDRWLTDRSSARTGAPLSHTGPNTLAPGSSGGETVLITAADDSRTHPGRLTLSTVQPESKTVSVTSENLLSERDWAVELSFPSSSHGWLRTSSASLLETDDGGAMWKDISPSHPHAAVAPRRGAAARRFNAQRLGAGPLLIHQSPPNGPHYSERLGFDEHNVPSIAAMGTWFDASPFFNIGTYCGRCQLLWQEG